jgi:hypothetical protein
MSTFSSRFCDGARLPTRAILLRPSHHVTQDNSAPGVLR